MPSLEPSTPLRSLVIVSLGPLYSLISMSTPAGRSSRISESTVLAVGSRMSMSRFQGAHLEVLAAVLVLVRRADDAVHVLLGRQRHRALDLCTRSGHRLDDLACRRVDDLVVMGLSRMRIFCPAMRLLPLLV